MSDTVTLAPKHRRDVPPVLGTIDATLTLIATAGTLCPDPSNAHPRHRANGPAQ